jgi:hypothetical protein
MHEEETNTSWRINEVSKKMPKMVAAYAIGASLFVPFSIGVVSVFDILDGKRPMYEEIPQSMIWLLIFMVILGISIGVTANALQVPKAIRFEGAGLRLRRILFGESLIEKRRVLHVETKVHSGFWKRHKDIHRLSLQVACFGSARTSSIILLVTPELSSDIVNYLSGTNVNDEHTMEHVHGVRK